MVQRQFSLHSLHAHLRCGLWQTMLTEIKGELRHTLTTSRTHNIQTASTLTKSVHVWHKTYVISVGMDAERTGNIAKACHKY